MQHQEYNKEPLRRYLLGDLDEEARIEIEARLLLDNDYNDQLLIVEEELIEEYDSGSLPPADRDKFEKNYLPTPNGKIKTDIANALNSFASAKPPVGTPGILGSLRQILRAPFVRASLGRAVVILLVTGLGLATYWYIFHRTATDQIASQTSALAKGISTLQSIYYSRGRPFAARFSDLGYVIISTTRGEREKTSEEKQAFGLLTLAAQEEPGASSYRNLGLYYLTQLAYDDAISELEKAVKYAPENFQAHNDLAVAYLERGKYRIDSKDFGRGNEDLARSSEHLSKALALNVSTLEALFNLALLHEAQFLPLDKIIMDWENYLRKDPSSGWAREAREHLEKAKQKKNRQISRTKAQTLQNFLGAYQSFVNAADEENRKKAERDAWESLSHNREAINDNLIWWRLSGNYLEASASNHAQEADFYLRALGFAGRLEAELGDLFVSNLAVFHQSCSPRQRNALLQAHGEIDRGHSLFLESKYDGALARYRNAKALYNLADDDQGALYAHYWESHILSQTRPPRESIEQLRQLESAARNRKCLWLQAQALTSLSGAYVTNNQYSQGFECNSAAVRIFSQLSDTFNVQRNLSLFADRHYQLGDYFGSLGLSGRSLQLSGDSAPGARQSWRLYKSVAQTLSTLGFHIAAADYQTEALKQAESANGKLPPDPTLILLSTVQLGVIYSKMGLYADAMQRVKYGLENSGLDFNQPHGKMLQAYALLQSGHIHRQANNPDEAITCYDQTIRICRELQLTPYFYEAYKGMAISHLARGDADKAEIYIQSALELADYFRENIVKENHKNTFFDVEQTIYDVYVNLEYERGNVQAAFDRLENSRARSLFSAINHDNAFPRTLKLNSLQQKIPDEVQIVEYAAMSDKLIIWVISKNQFSVKSIDIEYGILREKIDRYFELVSRPSNDQTEDIIQQSRELYDVLVGPIETFLDKGKTVCVVPDKVINYVPFNSLITSKGSLFATTYRLMFSPSASVFVRCTEKARQRAIMGEESALVVGNPNFDQQVHRLERLPESESEAIEISTLYKTLPVIGDNAREQFVKRQLARSNVAHFATHYIVDVSDDLHSKLLLTREPEESSQADGILESAEIRLESLPKIRLVILSACRSGIERYYNGEGMIGMSRTFLAAGAPQVVASLWPVNSEATKDLMIKFHKYRKNNRYSTVEALRLAQLDMAHSDQIRNRSPYYWAPFILIGGYANF